jgi:hypothetical protein
MITRDQINTINATVADIHKYMELASEYLRTAQDRNKTRKHTLERDGKQIELTEKILWEEVFYTGASSQAGKILKPLHPEVFEAYAKQSEASDRLTAFCIGELGINYPQMTISDYLKLSEGLFELVLNEREQGKDWRIAPKWGKKGFWGKVKRLIHA